MSVKKPDEKLVRGINPFGLRMLPELRQKLEEACRISGNSMNTEIVERLNRSFELSSAPPDVDLSDPVVQKAMVQRMQEVMGQVVEDMREEQRIANGMPLLLKWWERNPEERALYDQLSDDEQDEYVRENAHALWIEHLNDKRKARPGGARRRATRGQLITDPKAPISKRKK